MASYGESSPPAPEVMARLARVIGDRANHQSLIADTEGVLRQAEIERGDLPEGLFDVVNGLSQDQLDEIADACEKLVGHGFSIKTPDGTVCYL
jgi:hypothetical protein